MSYHLQDTACAHLCEVLNSMYRDRDSSDASLVPDLASGCTQLQRTTQCSCNHNRAVQQTAVLDEQYQALPDHTIFCIP